MLILIVSNNVIIISWYTGFHNVDYPMRGIHLVIHLYFTILDDSLFLHSLAIAGHAEHPLRMPSDKSNID